MTELRARSTAERCRISVGCILTAAMVTAGCATAPPSEVLDRSGSTTAPSSSVSPPPVDLATDLTPVVESSMRVNEVPGTVVLVRTPDSSWEKAFGTRTVAGKDPVTVKDSFRVGSITKTMVGTVMLQLVDEGLVRLSDPVSTYRPDVPGGDDITIDDLLTMRSGLFSYTEDRDFNQTLDEDPTHVWDPEELLRVGLAGEPYFAPGSDFRYSNTNTVLAGLIIQKITGNSVAKELQERVFDRVGLQHTRFPAPGDQSLPSPFAHGYLYGTNVSALRSPVLPESELREVRDGAILPTDVTDLDPSWIWAAGGTISTAEDLARYAAALVDGTDGLVRPATQEARIASVGERGQNPAIMRYGRGIAAFGPVFGHDGAIPGYQSFMGRDPSRRITIVVLCTVRDGPAGGRPANQIAYEIIRRLYGAR